MEVRFLIEWGPAVVAGLLALALGSGRFRFESPAWWDWIRRHPRFVAGAVTFSLCALLSWVQPPAPAVHDEFAYLLAGETFAAGRLTNPTPPAWEHFESLHILVQPSYQAKYPPAQGVFLAAGILLGGHPIVGVWLSMSLAAMALVWMLEAWFPPGWAFWGGLLPILRFGSLGNWNGLEWAMWSNTYWGGGVALLGGALLLGAAPHVAEKARPRDGLLLGLGLAILANARPYEGLVAAIVVGAAMLFQALRTQPIRRLAFCLAASVAVLAPTAGAMLAYNHAVTGDPLRMPYQEYQAQYEVTPQFTFLAAKDDIPEYRHEVFRRYVIEFQGGNYERGSRGSSIQKRDVSLLLSFFLGPALLLPLALGLLAARRYWAGVCLATVAISVAAHLVVATSHFYPHYLAPAIPALLALVVWGWRTLAGWSPDGRPLGPAIAAALVMVSIGAFALSTAWRSGHGEGWERSYTSRRSAIVRNLESQPGKHLVVLQYQPDHFVHQEWAYNGADIKGARILWARSMGAAHDQDLFDAFPDREIWLFNPDKDVFQPYPREPLSE